jgi:hypothetical protein
MGGAAVVEQPKTVTPPSVQAPPPVPVIDPSAKPPAEHEHPPPLSPTPKPEHEQHRGD